MVKQDIKIATAFIEALRGSSNAPMRWRFVHDSDDTQPAIECSGTVREIWPALLKHQKEGYGAFYFMNEIKPGAGSGFNGCATYKDVTRVLMFAGDLDGGIPLEWHLAPSLVTMTSTVKVDDKPIQKGQALWVPTDELQLDQFRDVQKRIAAYYKSDSAISNLSRVLRLPGSLHLKKGPQLVTFEMDIDAVAYTAADILKNLPEIERKQHDPVNNMPVSTEFLRMTLGWLDPDTGYETWRDRVAAIRATNLDDGNEAVAQELANAWSRGEFDREGRFKDRLPSKYTDDYAIEKVWETMPPKVGGVAFGSLAASAREAGYEGPPYVASAEKTFGDAAHDAGQEQQTKGDDKPFLLTEQNIFDWPDPEELVAGFIMCGENVCLYGPPKVGKTFIALDLALSIAANRKVFEQLAVHKSGPVVYLSGEGHAGMKRRLKAWRQARGIPKGERLPFYYKAAVPTTAKGAEECKRFIDGISKHLGKSPILVVIDTMARSMSGLNENDAGDVGLYLALTEGLRSALKCPVLTLAHSGKDETRGVRGSNASTAGFDAVWCAEMNPVNKTVKLDSKWLKDAEELGPFYFRLKPINVEGMKHGRGGVLEYVSADKFKEGKGDAADPLGPLNVGAALQSLGAIDQEHGVTTTVLAQALTEQREGEPEAIYKNRITANSKTLKRRLVVKPGPTSLKAYAYTGEATGGDWLWYLPALQVAA